MKTTAIEHSIWIDAPPERVWRAITQPSQLGAWYAPGCAWEIPELVTGGTVRFHNTETDIQVATIQVIDAPRHLVLRWQADPDLPDAYLDNTFILTDEAGGTRVTVRQTGYETLPENVRQAWIDADGEAYSSIVSNLKKYLENR